MSLLDLFIMKSFEEAITKAPEETEASDLM